MERAQLQRKYTGPAAKLYDQERINTEHWQSESTAVQVILESIGRGRTLLDVPVGTGRFISLYKRLNIVATGVDISDDMLEIAKAKASDISFDMTFSRDDIFSLNYPDLSFDLSICIRLFQWLDQEALRPPLENLIRVSRRHIIISDNVKIRLSDPSSGRKETFNRGIRMMKRRLKPKIYPGAPEVHDRRVFESLLADYPVRVTDMQYTGIYKEFCSVIYLLECTDTP